MTRHLFTANDLKSANMLSVVHSTQKGEFFSSIEFGYFATKCKNKNVSKILYQISHSDKEHALILSDAILTLGKKPTVKSVFLIEKGSTDVWILKKCLQTKLDVVAVYYKLLKTVQNKSVKSLVSVLLKDELEHLAILQEEYKKTATPTTFNA